MKMHHLFFPLMGIMITVILTFGEMTKGSYLISPKNVDSVALEDESNFRIRRSPSLPLLKDSPIIKMIQSLFNPKRRPTKRPKYKKPKYLGKYNNKYTKVVAPKPSVSYYYKYDTTASPDTTMSYYKTDGAVDLNDSSTFSYSASSEASIDLKTSASTTEHPSSTSTSITTFPVTTTMPTAVEGEEPLFYPLISVRSKGTPLVLPSTNSVQSSPDETKDNEDFEKSDDKKLLRLSNEIQSLQLELQRLRNSMNYVTSSSKSASSTVSPYEMQGLQIAEKHFEHHRDNYHEPSLDSYDMVNPLHLEQQPKNQGFQEHLSPFYQSSQFDHVASSSVPRSQQIASKDLTYSYFQLGNSRASVYHTLPRYEGDKLFEIPSEHVL